MSMLSVPSNSTHNSGRGRLVKSILSTGSARIRNSIAKSTARLMASSVSVVLRVRG